MTNHTLGALLAAVLFGACSSSDTESSSIVLNELLASSETSDDWVELYNPGDGDVALAGYELRDDNNFWIFPDGTIPAGGYLQVICDGSGENGKASFRLKASGEVVSVHGADGARIDRVAFPELQAETSWGRIPDGSGDWGALRTPSPGQPNIEGAPAAGGAADSVTPDATAARPDSDAGN